MIERMVDDIAAKGWFVQEGFVPSALVIALREDLITAQESGKLAVARIGRGSAQALNTQVRNDQTLWLSGETKAQQEFLALMDRVRLDLNRALYLGLVDYEAHYALYPPGGFYQKHLDSFRGARNRLVSTVTYLTEDWQQEDGGHLVLYDRGDENKELVRIQPQAGMLAMFLSEEIPHEVLPPRRARASIAGWFRCDKKLI